MASTYIQEAGTAVGARPKAGLVDPDRAAASGVSWPAILAGASAAAALSLVMLILGTGMGLGMASPWEGEGAEARTVGIAAIFWITFTQIAASGLGGYLAGRLRSKWTGIHTDEARFRDTAHGFLAWGVATLVSFALLASVVGSTLSAGARAGISVAGGVASAATGAAGAAGAAAANRPGEEGGGGPLGYWTDSLFRKEPGAAAAPADGAAAQTPAGNTPAEAARILANGLRTGSLPVEDSRHVAQLVAQRTGLSPAEAEKRVNDTYARAKAALDEGKARAKAAADAARKATAYGSLWVFLSLILGALVATYCASLGGRNRDL